MDPYENIVIGNFLYSLGLCIGQLSVEDVRGGRANSDNRISGTARA